MLEYSAEDARSDVDIIRTAMSQCGFTLTCAAGKIRNDIDMIALTLLNREKSVRDVESIICLRNTLARSDAASSLVFNVSREGAH